MRVTAKDVTAGWVDFSHTAPYFTEQKPIGTDRKRVEGPLPTQESFPNSWMPTKTTEESLTQTPPPPPAVPAEELIREHIEAARGGDVLPGVPKRLFDAWANAHDMEAAFDSSRTLRSLEDLTASLIHFIHEAARIGTKRYLDKVKVLEHYAENNTPRRMDEYDNEEVSDILAYVDGLLNGVHQGVLEVTRTTRDDWYRVQSSFGQQDYDLDDAAPLGHPPLTREQLRDRRGPQSPFVEDLWERKKRTELRGMRIRAIDVIRNKPQEEMGDEVDDGVAQPTQPRPTLPNPQEVTPGGDVRTMTIGEAGSWEESESGSGVEGSLFSYEKGIYIDDGSGDDVELRFYAFVEPLASRKRRLMQQAGRTTTPKAQELRSEADGMPDRGYINDIEVFYADELLFHRERAFTPKQSLTAQEFMAGDSMQRAISDLQQFIRTKIDPIPVGQFVAAAEANPGVGEGKLSRRIAECSSCTSTDRCAERPECRGADCTCPCHTRGAMKITAADVVPFDPSRRRLKQTPMTRKGPTPAAAPAEPENWEGLPDDPMDGASDYDALLYAYDNMAGGIEDVIQTAIAAQPGLDPAKQKEIGALIAKMRQAVRMLRS